MDTTRRIPFVEVQAWECPDCALWHYHHSAIVAADDPEVAEIAAELGVTAEEGHFEACPIFVFCQKCEGKFKLDYGDDEDDSTG